MAKHKFVDGLRKIGVEDGKVKYLARLTHRKPDGKMLFDTERTILAEDKADALRQRAQLIAQLLAEKTGGPVQTEAWTVQQAFDQFLPTLRTGTRTVWSSHATKICETFGLQALTDVDVSAVQKFLLELPIADDTVNNVRQCFKRVFDFAKDRGEWIGANPISEVTRRNTPKTDAEWLEELEQEPPARALLGDDLTKFLAGVRRARPELYVMVLTQLLLGCRFGEVSALQWRDIDFAHERGCMVVVRRAQYRGVIGPPKSKKVRQTAVGSTGRKMLEQHRAEMAELRWPGWETLVFPRPVGGKGRPLGKRHSDLWAVDTVINAIRKVMEDQGLKMAARTHALRHSMISVAQDDRSDMLLRKLVGHSSVVLTTRYTSLDDAKIISFAEAVERKMLSDADAVPSPDGENDGNRAPVILQPVEFKG